MKKITLLFVLLNITCYSQENLDSLIQGDWKILDSKYNVCIKFESGIISRRFCDSTNPNNGNSYPYKIQGDFIECIAHPLEQVHYKIFKIKGDTLIVDKYFPKVTKKDLKNRAPLKKRKRKFKTRQIWIRH